MRAELKPEERAARDREEVGAWSGLVARGEELNKAAMVKQAQDRREAGLPPEQERNSQGVKP